MGKKKNSKKIKEDFKKIREQNEFLCYQCGKCSAGCPMIEYMKDPPNKVIRYIQLGMFEKALSSDSIWLCASCETCSTRCPQEFDLAKFMDELREIAICYGYISKKHRDVLHFHNAFLEQVKKYGRSYEVGLIMKFKLLTLKSLNLFQDVFAGMLMFFRNKLKILPQRIKKRSEIDNIFKASIKNGKNCC